MVDKLVCRTNEAPRGANGVRGISSGNFPIERKGGGESQENEGRGLWSVLCLSRDYGGPALGLADSANISPGLHEYVTGSALPGEGFLH
jgi:hypothetical protein